MKNHLSGTSLKLRQKVFEQSKLIDFQEPFGKFLLDCQYPFESCSKEPKNIKALHKDIND